MTDGPNAPPTQVALRVADGPSPAYLAAAVEALMQVAGAQLCLVIITNHSRRRPSVPRLLLAAIDAAYDWLERRTLRGGPPALAVRPLGTWPKGVPILRDASLAQQADAMRSSGAEVLVDPDIASRHRRVPCPTTR